MFCFPNACKIELCTFREAHTFIRVDSEMCRLLAYFDNPANRNSKMSLLYYLFKKILIQWTLPTQCPTLLSLTSKAVCSFNWKANIIIGISVALQCWSPWLCNTSTFLTFSFHKYSHKKFPWSIIATRWTMSFHEFIKWNCHVLWISCNVHILAPLSFGYDIIGNGDYEWGEDLEEFWHLVGRCQVHALASELCQISFFYLLLHCYTTAVIFLASRWSLKSFQFTLIHNLYHLKKKT